MDRCRSKQVLFWILGNEMLLWPMLVLHTAELSLLLLSCPLYQSTDVSWLELNVCHKISALIYLPEVTSCAKMSPQYRRHEVCYQS